MQTQAQNLGVRDFKKKKLRRSSSQKYVKSVGISTEKVYKTYLLVKGIEWLQLTVSRTPPPQQQPSI